MSSVYLRGGKRGLDISLSFMGLLILAPVFAFLAVIVYFKLGRPVLYRQERAGRNGHPFTLVKFRTMTDQRDGRGCPMPDDARLTTFGIRLRSMSLDELPELWNVLRGDMSLVGPRPLLTSYLPLYSPRQARRHEVRPGITGWAQVTGRNKISWQEKFEKDVSYVDSASLSLDLKILVMTVRSVVRREGISAVGEVTSQPFTGN